MRTKDHAAYLYIIPSLLFILMFLFLPILYNVLVGFTDLRGVKFEKMSFIGFANYVQLVSDPIFLKSLTNVFVFMLLTLLFQMGLGLLLTVFLANKFRGHRVMELIFFMPVVLSSVVIAHSFNQIYEPNFGGLNRLLDFLGLGDFQRIWLGDQTWALYAILAANIYQWTGMGIIYYRVGLANISQEIYEAAKIDGAGFWQQLIRITTPLLKYSHLTIMLMTTIGTLKFFDLVYIMTGGGPAGSTEFPMTYLYKRLSMEGNNGLGSALATLVVILAIALAVVQTKAFKKVDVD
ncbi:carbohydrate ABC transporter permease [Paenibacillus xerothermodurans]|uniref:Sugar ABC transporter permease n=1 Tax=Paenibacillus xerothermodurans TaxID=1977292 RepID=A0A2W1NYV6_PAEXE|nr:sugar ABC transporter permease [Paenibacillus xerothermodurans]PZE20028.1 sugar ABC transporter permease [Paenibacillus xerothermodurans]